MNVLAYQTPASSKTERNGKSIKNSSKQPEEKQKTKESVVSDTVLTLEELKEQARKDEKEAQEREKEDAFRKTLEELAAQRRAFQEMLRKKKKLSYDATSDIAALTSAVNVGQVKSIAARLSIKANNLKLSAKESPEAAAALAVVKRVLEKAEIKIGRLKEEEVLAAQQKRAEKKRELEYADAVKRELEKRRKVRSAQEQSDLTECMSGSSKYHYSAPLDMTLLPPSVPAAADPVITEGSADIGMPPSITGDTAGVSVNVVV